MRLIFDPPGRPQDRLIVDGRTVRAGGTFTVPDERGVELLFQLAPEVREIPVKARIQRAK